MRQAAVRELRLFNFRNWREEKIEPSLGLNLLLGDNGQGKTNLLEAISILGLSRSLRANTEAELIGPCGDQAQVAATCDGATRELEVAVRWRLSQGRLSKAIIVDGRRRAPLALPGELPVVGFWPHDLDLVRSGPEARRRLLDVALVQLSRTYTADLTHYRRALLQRNQLLRRVSAALEPASSLDPWDAQLVDCGQRIWEERALLCSDLGPLARAEYGPLSPSSGETLEISYHRQEGSLEAAMASRRSLDLSRGVTTAGPHRDDVLISIEGKPARSYASQGQQRSAAVALRLAERALILERTGVIPVLILDDVLSELDDRRRQGLMERVAGQGQIWVTAASLQLLPALAALGERMLWRVEHGTAALAQAG